MSVLGVLSSLSVWGQASAGFGAVSGVVSQAGSEGLPEATVVLSNPSLHIELTMETTDDGVFHTGTVTPAAGYRLKVSRKGFTGWESPSFAVSTGQTVNFQIPLQAEGETKTEAGATASREDGGKTGTAEVVAAQELALLPASGRRLDALIPLAPAMTTDVAQPGVLVTRGLPFSNTFFTDGIDTTDTFFLQEAGIARQLAQEAVQDFQVTSSDAAAEYGRAMGGMINAGTRSGTTTYHGSAYGYLRSRGLGAKDAFAAGYDTRQKQQQFGADFGGPIYGDRLFFFANVEGLDRSAQGLNRITNPLIADPTGRTVLASNCKATAAQCAAAARFLQSQMNVLEPLWEHSVTGLAKIDYRRSDRNAISFEANALHSHAPSLAQTEAVAPNGGLIGDPTLHEETRFARLGWTGTVSPMTINDLHLGFYEDRITQIPTVSPLATGAVAITIAGATVGAGQPSTSILPKEHRFQLLDNFQRSYNSHLFQFGGDWSRTRDLMSGLANPAGTYAYASLTAFAEDFSASTSKNYTSFTQTLGNPLRILHERDINLYAQDTWRAFSRLTISYGLRYERPFLPKPNGVNNDFYQTSTISAPWLNLAPRFSLAYQVDPETVFRASAGLYYAPYPGQFLDTLFLGNGVYQPSLSVNPNLAGAPAFPKSIGSVASIPYGAWNVAYATSKLRNPYTDDINLTLERRIGKDSTLSVGYLRTRGYRMWTASDINVSPATTTETYQVDNAAGQSVGTYTTPYYTALVNPGYAHVYQVNNNGSYWYNALAVDWRARLSHGLSLWTSYTWSHAIDDLGVDSALGFALTPSSTGDLNNDRGRSALDQRHRAVIRWTWEPVVGGGRSLTRSLVNGWAVSGLATLASSQPATPMVLVQGQQFSSITMDYTSSLSGSGGWSRVPFDLVNSLSTGAQYIVDAHVARTFSFTERLKGTVAFEAFNLLNRQYATVVNTIAYLSVSPLAPGLINGPHSGSLQPVPGLGAGIASQGFPDGTNARRCQVVFRLTF